MNISIVVVLLLLLISGSSQVVIQFFAPDQNARNDIALECIANGLARPGATFQFFSGLDESTLQSDIFLENDHLEVTVEHTSEQFIRCVFNLEMSNFLAIAGTLILTLYTNYYSRICRILHLVPSIYSSRPWLVLN